MKLFERAVFDDDSGCRVQVFRSHYQREHCVFGWRRQFDSSPIDQLRLCEKLGRREETDLESFSGIICRSELRRGSVFEQPVDSLFRGRFSQRRR